MMVFTISYRDEQGNEHELTGEPEQLAEQLQADGYNGPSIQLFDEPGFSRGYVSAGNYSLR